MFATSTGAMRQGAPYGAMKRQTHFVRWGKPHPATAALIGAQSPP
jgi:hypothetical protein